MSLNNSFFSCFESDFFKKNRQTNFQFDMPGLFTNFLSPLVVSLSKVLSKIYPPKNTHLKPFCNRRLQKQHCSQTTIKVFSNYNKSVLKLQ